MAKYTLTVLHLVSMLLRPTISFPLALPEKTQALIEILRKSLDKKKVSHTAKQVYNVLVNIWTQEWLPTNEMAITDPTINYLILSTIQRDGSFQEPVHFTTFIAQFQYCMRVVFMIHISQAEDREKEALLVQRWHTEKVESTFNSLRTIQHLASSIAYSTMSLPNIWWTDLETHRSLLFKGYPIDFKSFPSMFQAMEQEMMGLWQDRILCGLPLRIEYSTIFDDLSDKSPGYSFQTDRRNSCFSDRTILASAILHSPELYRRFIAFNENGVVIWNVHELRKWLQAYSDLQGLFLARCNMATGSASRSTEITALLRTNTTLNPVRNFVMFGNYATVLCTYQKTSALLGNDRIIPHALDAFMSDLIIQNSAIALPFAEIAAHICFHNSAKVLQLYRTNVFVNYQRLFTTEDLTSILERITLTHLKVKLGVNSWRHVSTAFRRKLCGQLDDLMEQDSMDNVQALQSGHSRQVENRVYALSQEAFAGLPEDLLPLFLRASTQWQKEICVYPGGTIIPYSKALSSDYVPPPPPQSLAETMQQMIDSSVKAHLEVTTKAILENVNRMLLDFGSTQTASIAAQFKEQMLLMNCTTQNMLQSLGIYICLRPFLQPI